MKTKLLSMMLLLMMTLWGTGTLSAQNVAITVGNVSACPGTTNVFVPIYADNLSNVGSISLSLIFNNANLTYTGYVSGPTIAGSGVAPLVNNPINAPSKIIISWFSLSPIALIPNGEAIFNLKFTVNGSSSFNWDLSPQSQGACEISDADGMPYNVSWGNGSVTAALPDADFTSTPSICAGQDATVSVDFTSGSAPFTIVFNDGVNPNDTVTTSDDPYTFTSAIANTTTWNLVSISTSACTNPNVNKSATTTLAASPTVFSVTGGGAICPGGAGVEIGLDNSETGTSYELFADGITTGINLSGNGNALSFGVFSATGTYTVAGVNSCETAIMSGGALITVSSGVTVTLDPFTDVCYNVNMIALSGGSPTGGIYSGIGVLDGNFYPSVAGPGTYTIAYTFIDNGCTGSATQDITVIIPPIVTINALDPLCESSDPVAIIATPEGGTFSGTGVVGNTFFPSAAGPGTWEVVYSYTSADGVCTVSVSTLVTVYTPETITFDALSPVCENEAAFFLSATPSGGTFSGIGVDNGEFNPALAGVGTFTITYTYTDGNGCIATANQDITVNDMIDITFSSLGTYCANATPFYLTDEGLGGTFSGPGVSMEGSFYYFDPAVAGPGTHTITYDLTETNGCHQVLTSTVTVNSIPVATLTGTTSICEGAEATIALTIDGNGPYYVTIADGSSLNNFSTAGTNEFIVNPLSTTTFTLVSVTDINGCTINPDLAVTVTVNPTPVILIDPFSPLCLNGGVVTLNATPTGGVFTGIGVTGNQFDPAVAGPGIFDITYSLTDENGCTATAVQALTVMEAPVVTLEPVSPMCQTAEPVILVGSPAGGLFSGNGVEGNTFNPALAGPGMHSISYTYTDMFGCSGVASAITIVVFATPEVTLDPLPTVCVSSGPLNLTANPAGGVFSGTGVTGSAFYPATAGIGTYVITYLYTDVNGCSNSASQEITVTASPVVIFEPIMNACADAGAIALIATPSGGTFSGTGVMNGSFYPQLAGTGTFTLTYTYSLGTDCSGTGTQDVTVFPLPVVSVDPVSALCATAAAITLNGSPGGGSFSGSGVVGNTFDPAITGAGTFQIEYSYTDMNGCSSVANTQVTVNETPAVSLIAAASSVCLSAGPVELTGTPAGGIYSGTGVSANYFYPSTGAGVYTLTYSYTNEFGCSNSAETTITVNAVSVFAGDDVTINLGTSTTLTAIVSGGTAPYTYSWTPASGLNDPALGTVIASPVTTTAYSVMVMDALNCMAVDEVVVSVVVPQNILSGHVTYPNAVSSPLANVQITLQDLSGAQPDQVIYTDANGYYSFASLLIGSYAIHASYSHPWGGGNATDGLIMLRHFVGLTTLSGIKLAAGDVTGNGYVSSHDALNTLRRFLGTLASFAPVGDWTFDSPTVIMDGISNQEVNFHGLCMGDVNADYNVNGAKTAPNVMLTENGSVSALNGIIELPVLVAENMSVGSFSIVMNLPANYTVKQVSLSGDNSNLNYSVEGSELRIGWYNIEPMNLLAGQALFTLSLRAPMNMAATSITLDGNSVITDEMANTIENAQLLVPKISAASMAINFNCYPNPVISNTNFSYTLPEGGLTRLELYNALGDQVALIVNEVLDAGNHSVKFDASSLAQGIYLSRLTVNGITETKTITISR